MKSLNYNEISKLYNDIRKSDLAIIQRLISEPPSWADACVPDIDCGTGNHTNPLQQLTQAKVYGLEPSAGMLAKARQKNEHITFKPGRLITSSLMVTSSISST